MTSVIAVREATVEDLGALREVYRDASLSNAGDRDALLAHPDVLLWVDDNLRAGRTRVATDEAGTVLGFATTRPTPIGLELEDLFVRPQHMRRGVASLLVADAVETARREGHASIDVTGSPHAAAFYASVGFVRIGDEQTLFGPAPRLRLTVPHPQGSM